MLDKLRFRRLYVVLGTFLVFFLWLITDPDVGLIQHLSFGAGLLAMLVFMSKGLLASVLLYVTRKAMFDYKEADLQNLGVEAKKDPQAAALYSISIAIQTLAFAVVIAGALLS